MNIQPAPEGWRFYSADFSLQAVGKDPYGTVQLIRDPESKKLWHKQSEQIKESEDCPELFITGKGTSFTTAMTDASKKALEAKPIILGCMEGKCLHSSDCEIHSTELSKACTCGQGD